MTVGFLSYPIMRPNHCWTVLHVSILAMLLLTLNADSEDSECVTEIKVRRSTVYKALLGEDLRINCTVTFCNNSPPTVSWHKIDKTFVPVNVSSSSHIKTEWIMLKHLEGMSFLIFKNILSSDSGQYRCQSQGSMGHTINVSVYGVDDLPNVTCTYRPTTTSTTSYPDSTEIWLYVYCAAGIVAFVIIVIIISVISMRGCKGKSKRETKTDNQYMEIPMDVQQPSHARVQAPPRGSPSAPPSRRSTRRKTTPSQSNVSTLSRDNEHASGKVTEDRQRQRNVGEEEEGSVVYAALNHQVQPRAPARLQMPQDECSEYAAIRVP